MLKSWITTAVLLFVLSLFVGCQNKAQPNVEKGAKTATQASAAETGKLTELAGVNTKNLTNRERDAWSTYVNELLAPCPDQPVSIAQCVTEKRKCDACLPAAQFLSKQVTRGKTRNQAEKAYQLRFSPDTVKSIDLTGSAAKGTDAPTVTIVEWADFECPFCGMASPVIGRTAKAYPEHVQVVFKNMPLAMHEHAEPAARASVAAGMQGKFWQMHDIMFQNQKSLDEKSLERLAKEAGLDIDKFNQDRRSEAVVDQVSKEKKQAKELNAGGTPTIYINGRLFDLESFDLAEDLGDWIELEILLRTGKTVQAVAK